VPEPRGVDGELGAAEWAGAARQPDGHAEERAAHAAGEPCSPHVRGTAGQRERLPPGRAAVAPLPSLDKEAGEYSFLRR